MELIKCLYGGSDKKLCTSDECNFCYNLSFASHEKSKFLADENEIDARNIFKGSGKKYIFVCNNNECNHKFEAQISCVTKLIRPTWCPFCSGNKLCTHDECNICYNRSFASHEKSKLWSKKNKNKPREIFKNSGLHFIFDCDICEHEYSTRVVSVVSGCLCGFCQNKYLCGEKTCTVCFNKSFASHEKSKYWSKNNKKKPYEVFRSSCCHFKFDCNICEHEFEIRLDLISRGSWCCFCFGKELCSNDTCDFCYNKSFASHEKSKYWSKKNKQSSRQVNKRSDQKAIFDCPLCDEEYESMCYSVANGASCNCTVNKTESKLFKWLTTDKGYCVTRGAKFDFCKNIETGRHLPFDFVIDILITEFDGSSRIMRILIELDGEQHFKDMICWRSLNKDQRERDVYKTKKANENGYDVIRLLQTDVFSDKNNWQQLLDTAIDNLKYTYGKVMNQYIAVDNIYSEHIFDMYMLDPEIENITIGKQY